MSRRFAYALEPLRLQRVWRLDDLRLQLSDLNRRIAGEEQRALRIVDEGAALRQECLDLAGPARSLRPEVLAAYSTYLARLERQLAQVRARQADLDQESAALGERLAQAMRELDAVERHKSDTRTLFCAEQAKADAKDADDHWSILTSRRTHAGQA